MIDGDPSAPLSLAMLAQEVGLGRFQFVRGFARHTGSTPHAYLLQRRIHRARGLITGGRGSSGQRLCRPEPHDTAVRAQFRFFARGLREEEWLTRRAGRCNFVQDGVRRHREHVMVDLELP